MSEQGENLPKRDQPEVIGKKGRGGYIRKRPTEEQAIDNITKEDIKSNPPSQENN